MYKTTDKFKKERLTLIKMFRLNNEESETIRKLAIDVNKKRIENNIEPVKDSELLHEILEQALKKIIITNSGKISFDL